MGLKWPKDRVYPPVRDTFDRKCFLWQLEHDFNYMARPFETPEEEAKHHQAFMCEHYKMLGLVG